MKVLRLTDESLTWWVEYRTAGMKDSDNEVVVGISSQYSSDPINYTDVDHRIVPLGVMTHVGQRFNEKQLVAFAITNKMRLIKKYEKDSDVFLRKSTSAEFISYSVPGIVGQATINSQAGTIAVGVTAATNRAALVATFTLSPLAVTTIGATPQVSGVTSNNFTSPVTYKVICEDAPTFKEWDITITNLSNAALITGFVLDEQTGAATIDNEAGTIVIEVAEGTDPSELTPTITVSAGAQVEPSSLEEVDFSDPVVYKVTSQDKTVEKEYTVTVTVASGS